MARLIQVTVNFRPLGNSPEINCTAINAYFRKREQVQLYNIIRNLKILQKQQSRPKAKTGMRITKIKTEIN